MEIEISKNYNARRLQQWLDYELSSLALMLLSWFWNFAIFLMIIAAFLFTPFMIKILFEERRFGWIIFFLLIVVIPVCGVFLLGSDSTYASIIRLIPLALFYFYCFVLRLAVKDW
ncbi:MAG: hypothetical protein NTX65_01470 [Ignavibacteriales bacterium]|nr:hypothetical protein [Ignavibacteriales bacterium]